MANVTKTTKPGVRIAKPAKPSPVEDVAEVVEEVSEEAVQEVAEVSAEPKSEHKMVRVAVNKRIDPAPRVGRIDLVRDFSLSFLEPKVYTLPKPVADHLVDKKLAQYV